MSFFGLLFIRQKLVLASQKLVLASNGDRDLGVLDSLLHRGITALNNVLPGWQVTTQIGPFMFVTFHCH